MSGGVVVRHRSAMAAAFGLNVKPNRVVIFDLDGTLALIQHRRPLVELQDGSPVTAAGAPAVFRGPNPHVPGNVWVEFMETGKWSYHPSSVKFKPDWKAFHAACVDDLPNMPVIRTLRAHAEAGHDVFIVSGRSDEVRQQTVEWLHLFGINYSALIMRRAGDYTPDDVLKRSWLSDGTLPPRERILCVYDDRDRVVRMWREQGLACFQVAPGDF